LLEDLPTELRLRIYDHVFDERFHCSLLIRSGSKVELISLAKAHAALLKTCKTIYSEAAPVLYDTVTFRVQVYPVDGYPSYGNISHLSKNTLFLPRMRHLDLKASVIHGGQMKLALYLIKTLTEALEEAQATISSLHVTSNFRPDHGMMFLPARTVSGPVQNRITGKNGDLPLFDHVMARLNDGPVQRCRATAGS
jgi:hypothetical protein